MSLTLRIILAISFLILAAAATFLIAPLFDLAGAAAYLLGLAVFVLAYLGFDLFSRSVDADHAELALIKRDVKALADSLDTLTGKIEAIRADSLAGQERNQTLVSEVRVLQTLLGQVVSRKRGAPAIAKPVVGDRVEALRRVADNARQAKAPRETLPKAPMADLQPLDAEQLDELIRTALSENRIDLYLQPIVSLPNRKSLHYEGYSRVRDDQGEIIFPEQYLPFIEEKGLVGTLDNLLLFRCIQLVRKLGNRRPDSRFFINISSSSLADREFFSQFIDYMTSNTSFADRLVFEFAQADIFSLEDDIFDPLRRLARRGYRFSLDHVTDKRLDPQWLSDRGFAWVKLDHDVLMDDSGDIFSSDLHRLLARQHIELIGSKIETEDQVLKVLDMNIGFAQGFLFGEPRLSRDEPTA